MKDCKLQLIGNFILLYYILEKVTNRIVSHETDENFENSTVTSDVKNAEENVNEGDQNTTLGKSMKCDEYVFSVLC